MQLAAGVSVGNYVVQSVLGGGGMATLYRVKHALLGTVHALKVLEPVFRDDAEARSRFLSEGMIAARIHHPNVVRVTDAVATPEVAGLVMELVEGVGLDEHIRRIGRPASPGEVRAIFLPVLDGIAEAHRQGVIHRDIKPANILLQQSPDGPIPKVTDFGIAKITDEAFIAKKGSTRADARMGTINYMSPEQVRGAREVTVRSDVFSLGATLYELATGEEAFDGESDFDVMQKIVTGHLRPPEASGVEPSLAAVIRRAMAVDPAERFASCEEFAAALGTATQPWATAAPSPARRTLNPPATSSPSPALSKPVAPPPQPPTVTSSAPSPTPPTLAPPSSIAAPALVQAPSRAPLYVGVGAVSVVALIAVLGLSRPTPVVITQAPASAAASSAPGAAPVVTPRPPPAPPSAAAQAAPAPSQAPAAALLTHDALAQIPPDATDEYVWELLRRAEAEGLGARDRARAANDHGYRLINGGSQPEYSRALPFFEYAARSDSSYGMPRYNAAKCFAARGDVDGVVRYLGEIRALGRRQGDRLSTARTDPAFASVASDSRFQALFR